ncbi:MAG: hypothetical protein U0935_02160 [Pirellulales bacterium]
MDEHQSSESAEAPVTESPAVETEPGEERMQQVGQAMITAAVALRRGADDARLKAQQLAPAVGESLSKAVYATCYYLSYGVVFPTVFVASLVPLDNAVGYGMIDGANAAKEAVANMRARRQARREAARASLDVGLVPAAT